jgi:PIN domain nuclease of toxin-antitoxin system
VITGLLGEPEAGQVERLLRDREDPPRISAANVAEIVDVLTRRARVEPSTIRSRLEWLVVGGLAIEPLDERLAVRAGELRAIHYDRARTPLSLADCCALATALDLGESLATANRPLADAARLEGCRVIWLAAEAGAT